MSRFGAEPLTAQQVCKKCKAMHSREHFSLLTILKQMPKTTSSSPVWEPLSVSGSRNLSESFTLPLRKRSSQSFARRFLNQQPLEQVPFSLKFSRRPHQDARFLCSQHRRMGCPFVTLVAGTLLTSMETSSMLTGIRSTASMGAADEAPGATIVQPCLRQRVQFLMTVSGSLPFATLGGGAQIAVAPARVSRNPIDHSAKTGSLLHDRSAKSLFVNTKDAFDLKSDRLMNFLDAMNRHCWAIRSLRSVPVPH